MLGVDGNDVGRLQDLILPLLGPPRALEPGLAPPEQAAIAAWKVRPVIRRGSCKLVKQPPATPCSICHPMSDALLIQNRCILILVTNFSMKFLHRILS